MKDHKSLLTRVTEAKIDHTGWSKAKQQQHQPQREKPGSRHKEPSWASVLPEPNHPTLGQTLKGRKGTEQTLHQQNDTPCDQIHIAKGTATTPLRVKAKGTTEHHTRPHATHGERRMSGHVTNFTWQKDHCHACAGPGQKEPRTAHHMTLPHMDKGEEPCLPEQA